MQFAFLAREINEMLTCLIFNGQISTKKKKEKGKEKEKERERERGHIG